MFKFTLDQLMTTLPENLQVTFLYLRAHVTTLERRIQGRGRDAESGVTLSYLESLDQRHHHWLRKVNADGFHQVYELNANLAASDVFERVCQLDIPDLRVDQPGVIPEGDLTATSLAPPPSNLAMAATETAIAAARAAVALTAAASLSFLGDQLFTGPATDVVNMGEASIPSPPPSPPHDEFEEDGSASLLTRLISVRVDYPRPLDMPMAKVVVPNDLTVAQFVVRVQALLQDYTGERVATHAALQLWQMKLASDTMTPLLFPPTPAGTPAHRRSWDPDKPISATGITHHSVVTVSRIAQDSAPLITVFVSCPNQARAGTPMAKIEVPAHLTVRQFAEAVQSTVFQGDLRWWPHPDLATWQIRVMPGNTVVEDAQSTLLCPPAAPSSTHLRPGGYGSISAAGVVHHSVVAISRRALPTAYYGIRCATGFSAVFSTWEGARPFIEGHHVSHGKFKTQHHATVFASYCVNLRTSPDAYYPRYVPAIVLDAPPADYRGRCAVPPPLDTFTEAIMTPYLASHGVRDASQPDTQTRSTYQPASRLAQPDGAHRTAVELNPAKTGRQQGARCAEDLEALAPGCVSRTDHAAARVPSSQFHISPPELPLEVAKGCEPAAI